MYVSNCFNAVKRIGTLSRTKTTNFTRQIEITQHLFANLNLFRNTLLWPRSMPQQNRVTASQARVVSLVCIWTRTEPTTHTQWSALCVLKWHKSFRTYDYSWGPTLCVTLSNIAAHISILTYFRHLSARSIEKAVVTFSMNRAFSAIVQKPLLSWLFWTVMHQNFSLKYDGAFIHGHGGFFESFYISLLLLWSGTAKRILERLGVQTSSSFVKIW